MRIRESGLLVFGVKVLNFYLDYTAAPPYFMSFGSKKVWVVCTFLRYSVVSQLVRCCDVSSKCASSVVRFELEVLTICLNSCHAEYFHVLHFSPVFHPINLQHSSFKVESTVNPIRWLHQKPAIFSKKRINLGSKGQGLTI